MSIEQDVKIDPDGTLHVDGKVVTPEEAKAAADKLTKAVQVARGDVAKAGGLWNWIKGNTRTIEKAIAYGAAAVGATNGFAQVAMPTSVRTGLIVAGGVAVALDKIIG